MDQRTQNFYAFAFGKLSGQDYAESRADQTTFLYARAQDEHDADVMLARMMAKERGASLVEVQGNVMALDSDAYPVQVRRWGDFS